MLYYSLAFFLIAVMAALLGFGNIATGAVDIARILFVIFLVLFLLSVIFQLFRRGSRR